MARRFVLALLVSCMVLGCIGSASAGAKALCAGKIDAKACAAPDKPDVRTCYVDKTSNVYTAKKTG